MDTFAPEFSRFWLPADQVRGEHRRDEREDEAHREQQALEELVERVNAARSIL